MKPELATIAYFCHCCTITDIVRIPVLQQRLRFRVSLLLGGVFLSFALVGGFSLFHLFGKRFFPPSLPISSPTPQPQATASEGELRASVPLEKPNLLYAESRACRVSVYRRNIKGETEERIEEKLFEYEERDGCESKLGPFPPLDAALSPDQKSLAFIDKEGLKVFSLTDRAIQKLITISSPTRFPGEEGPLWSVKEWGKGVLGIHDPQWSADGKFISVVRLTWEGLGPDASVVNLQTKQRCDAQETIGKSSWSPTQTRFVAAFSNIFGTMEGRPHWGFFISSPHDVCAVRNVTHVLGLDKVYTKFGRPIFSPTGDRIVFVFTEGAEEPSSKPKLAVVNPDATGFKVLREFTSPSEDHPAFLSPFFSPDGKYVYYGESDQSRRILWRYSLATSEAERILVFPEGYQVWDEPFWQNSGRYLVISGSSSCSSCPVPERTTQFFIFDLENGQTIYRSRAPTYPIRILGLS